ncbi:MAG: DUF4855 domain-containing protein [Muribaculaceae bacterium]|nr:DUF4855 domain-containing protein [Muribaculaceae bacterium]
MKFLTHSTLAFIAASFIGVTGVSCSEQDHTVPPIPGSGDSSGKVEIEPGKIYDWEASRTEVADYTDMVLLYGGGTQRYVPNWEGERLQSYVTYTDRSGHKKWFFDAFLFIEFADYGYGSANVTYATGYRDPSTQQYLNSATKADWERLAEYYFKPGKNIMALDAFVGQATKTLGKPSHPRQVIMTIPEPIRNLNCRDYSSPTTYWGEIDGRKLDFSKTADRVAAVQWYIDYIRALFDNANLKNVELAGFYWLAEHATESTDILDPISEYLHKMNYSFNWIPYFNANGYAKWKSYGFDYAFLQPNYFFNEATPISQLEQACQMAASANMAMEMEFDDNALARNGRAYKLRNYMDAFRRYKVWNDRPLAYYQGNNTVYTLRTSSSSEDVALYHEFGEFVTTRPYRIGR